MIDQDRALPIKIPFNHNWFWGAVAQRDADWERMKVLIKALKEVSTRPRPTWTPWAESEKLRSLYIHAENWIEDMKAEAEKALAQIGVEVQP